jgi:hypothetical protein
MRHGPWGGAFAALLVILIFSVVAVIAYNVGYDHGLAANPAFVREPIRRGWGGWWIAPLFFPFAFLFVFFGIMTLFRLALFGRHPRHWAGGGPYGWGPPRERLAEWHRQLHEAGRPPAGSGPSGEPPASESNA